MINTLPTRTTEFKDGDNVVLAEGTYQGTPGVFVRLRPDVNWAEIRERNGLVRCHPVVWLQHAEPERGTPCHDWPLRCTHATTSSAGPASMYTRPPVGDAAAGLSTATPGSGFQKGAF